MNNQETMSEKVVKSVQSEDRPLGEVEPAAPFVMVGLSYMMILIGLMALAAVAWVIVG